jgi:hypothetical protein
MRFKTKKNLTNPLWVRTWAYAIQVPSRQIKRRGAATANWTSLLLSVALTAVLAACGGSNNTNLHNPPAPPVSAVSIAFQPAPSGSISLAGTATITAVVSNDPTSAGVDWALLCQSNTSCGTLAPLHTASGTAATYAPPTVISGNSQSVTIEAFATADHSKNVVATFNITAFASVLKGTYVFETNGEDANGPYQLAGVIVLDGNGHVISGEQTHNDPLLSRSDPITGGSYYIGPDGRGTITINTADQNIGQLGVENLSLAFLSSSQALIATFDNPNLQPSLETSSGTLHLQTSTKAPTGGYAFAVNGSDTSLASLAMGGILNIDSPNAISGAGSVVDQDLAGNTTFDATVSGNVTSPDPFGSLKFNLTTGPGSSLQFTGYIVDPTHIKLIESDNAGAGAGFVSAGVAISQGAATGRFTSNSAFAGNYVLDIVGQDPSGIPVSLASYGQFTADASGNLNNGFDDEILSAFAIAISDSFTGTYTLDPSGTGRVDANINYSTNGPGPELIFYLTGNGNPPLILDADDNGSSLGVGSIGIGLAHPQAAAPFLFNGKYGFTFTQSNSSVENNATGRVTVDQKSGTVNGLVDTNLSFSSDPSTAISGTFGVIPNSGRLTGSLNNTFFPTPVTNPNTISVAFYPVDASHLLFIETDLTLSGISTVGYFTTRTSLCTGCQ